MEHEEPTASVAGQLLVCPKPGKPAVAIDEIVSSMSPVLDSITVCVGLVVPTRCNANVSDDCDREPTAAMPVPESVTVWPVAGPATLIVRGLDIAPRNRGANVTLMVQLAPTAREAPQSFV